MPLSRAPVTLIQLAEVRGVHGVELSHYMSVNEALQAQLAALHAERDGFTRAIAQMRSVRFQNGTVAKDAGSKWTWEE